METKNAFSQEGIIHCYSECVSRFKAEMSERGARLSPPVKFEWREERTIGSIGIFRRRAVASVDFVMTSDAADAFDVLTPTMLPLVRSLARESA